MIREWFHLPARVVKFPCGTQGVKGNPNPHFVLFIYGTGCVEGHASKRGRVNVTRAATADKEVKPSEGN